jgi:L-serine dehydratase
MTISLFELFKIGVGPSSSHTVGPMVAARRFTVWLDERGLLGKAAHVEADLYGSLALTGKGHAADTAVVAGLAGEIPAETSLAAIKAHWDRAENEGFLYLLGRQRVRFQPARDLHFQMKQRQPFHSNALSFTARDSDGEILAKRMYFSIGGGFVVDEEEAGRNSRGAEDEVALPFAFTSGADLLSMGAASGKSFAEMMLDNELVHRSPEQVEGCCSTGTLPGGLKVKRRAPQIAADIRERHEANLSDPMAMMDWINLWAMAVNEENAAGGKVVTAPTNGAAGIIPAVIRYYRRSYRGDAKGVRTFLLAAGAVGALYKRNASISGAEVGCQGEVGVACSMAAAGLTAALGGTNAQVENAAEIGMEHNLGLTCDPIGGLVQIPCIERNAMGAIKAIDASRIAMIGDGTHVVSLDTVIATMLQTGRDMRDKYKETSKGGLAVSVVEC